jgi:hypothetical protein
MITLTAAEASTRTIGVDVAFRGGAHVDGVYAASKGVSIATRHWRGVRYITQRLQTESASRK